MCFQSSCVADATHRLCACCMFNYSSGVVLNTRDKRKAMSGVISWRSLTIAESVLREICICAARAVTVSPRCIIYIRRKIPLGWFGFLVADMHCETSVMRNERSYDWRAK